jgi:threonine dehydrogenase-like Zn-dependent dehydrogenase
MHRAGDVRVEERANPRIVDPTDAVIRLTSTCICGSDLWPYRGIEPADHQVMGHEYMGVVEQVGSKVSDLHVGDHVLGSFVISDNTCEICRSGYASKCVHAEFVAQTIGTQAERARIPYADGTLVRLPGEPDAELVPHLLAASDVLGTGWFGCGRRRPVGDDRTRSTCLDEIGAEAAKEKSVDVSRPDGVPRRR